MILLKIFLFLVIWAYSVFQDSSLASPPCDKLSGGCFLSVFFSTPLALSLICTCTTWGEISLLVAMTGANAPRVWTDEINKNSHHLAITTPGFHLGLVFLTNGAIYSFLHSYLGCGLEEEWERVGRISQKASSNLFISCPEGRVGLQPY